MMGDNFTFNVLGEGRKMLDLMLQVIALGSGHDRAVGYRDDGQRLVFAWSIEGTTGFTPLVAETPTVELGQTIELWLRQAKLTKEPDHDGDNQRGWRLYTGSWGHIDSDHHTYFAVEPAWMMYGK
jgi:hypothetical protein